MMRGCGLVFGVVSVLLTGFCFCENYPLTNNQIPLFGEHDTSAVHAQLLSILDRLTSLDERFNAFDGRITALDQRVTALDQRLERRVGDVSNKVEELLRQSNSVSSKVLQDLRGVCAELKNISDNATSQSGTTTSPPVEEKPDTTFRITRVTKTETEDTYNVRVEYEATTKPTVLLSLSSMVLTTPLEGQELGVTVVEVPKWSPGDDYYGSSIYLHFVFPELVFMAQLRLDDTHDTMDIPRLQLHVQQGNDVTFKPGNQVELDFTFTIEGDLNNIEYEDARQHILVKSDTEENVVYRYHGFFSPNASVSDTPVWVDVVKFGGDKGNRFATVVIDSTRQDPEGILDVFVKVGFNCSRNCLLCGLEVHRSVKFYREDHSGPFPDGFIGFIRDEFEPDISHFYCSLDEANQCYVYCEAAGSSPLVSMDISKVDANGDMKPTNDVTLFRSYWGFSQLVFDDVSAADAGDFRCTARSQTKEITLDLSLDIVIYARIDHELITATRFKNGSVSATCVATGEPAPNVTLTTVDKLSPEQYDVTTTSLDNSTRVDVFIADYDVASTVYLFECFATNVGSEGGDFYSIYVNSGIYDWSDDALNDTFYLA